MTRVKRNFFISFILIILVITFTFSVKIIDVKQIGVNETSIGFSSLNQLIFNSIGINMIWYHITEWLGIIPIILSITYTLIGFIQLVKRKNILKIDKEIIILGIFYIIIIFIYILFEKYIINYRPILIDNILEASYPSSHTLMTICICGSSIIINKKIFNNKITQIINIVSIIVILLTVIGRLISGAHWFTDIIGGILISISLLMTLYSVIETIKNDYDK